MKTKAFQTLLKVWITIASVAAFLFGWIVLGHSGKPVAANSGTTTTDPSTNAPSYTTLPTLPPLPNLGTSSSGSSLQALPQTQSQPSTSFLPRFRTRGS